MGAGERPVPTVHPVTSSALVPLLRTAHAVVFDTDGVVIDSAGLHAASWKDAFDPVLAEADQPPFDAHAEYLRWVDGKPRIDGAVDLLTARGVRLPWGDVSDRPGTRTVHAVAARKEQAFVSRISTDRVEALPGFLPLARVLRARGTVMAAVSSSRHAPELLRRAGVSVLFGTVVAGDDAARLGLPGKPSPALFLEACQRLGVSAGRSAVIEDALAGVEAGQAGGFQLVVGVDRAGDADHARDLRRHGADLVVEGLGDLLTHGGNTDR